MRIFSQIGKSRVGLTSEVSFVYCNSILMLVNYSAIVFTNTITEFNLRIEILQNYETKMH